MVKRVKLAAIRRGQVTWSQDFRGKGRPWGIFFGFYKIRHILLSDSANCTVLRAVVLTQYRRVTDGRTDRQTDRQTDGITVASTALAMQALRRAVKTMLLQQITYEEEYIDADKNDLHQRFTAPHVVSFSTKCIQICKLSNQKAAYQHTSVEYLKCTKTSST